MLECDIRVSTMGLVIYRHTWVFIAGKDSRVNGMRVVEIRSIHSFPVHDPDCLFAIEKSLLTRRIDSSNAQFNRVSSRLVDKI